MITIVDYGMGNLVSIKNMIKKVGGKAEITSELKRIEQAQKIILPGVGHFGKAMSLIAAQGLDKVLDQKALKDKVSVLGICLGMQLLTNHSEEGDAKGLGWINAETIKFRFSEGGVPIPHMAWTDTQPIHPDHPLFEGIAEPRFYYVHSYHVKPAASENVLCTANYGGRFVSGLEAGNIMGVQFHPEKSHRFGMLMIKNFIDNFA